MTAVVPVETVILEVSATDVDPLRATRIANASVAKAHVLGGLSPDPLGRTRSGPRSWRRAGSDRTVFPRVPRTRPSARPWVDPRPRPADAAQRTRHQGEQRTMRVA